MADLELGNIAFNSNTNQIYNCPNYIIALLREIDRVLCKVMWNINQEEYDSPFSNTGNTFKNDVFEVQAYNWNDDINQEYNFIYRVDKAVSNMPDLKISWYKYLGRDTTINQEVDSDIVIDIFNRCIDSLMFMNYDLSKK